MKYKAFESLLIDEIGNTEIPVEVKNVIEKY